MKEERELPDGVHLGSHLLSIDHLREVIGWKGCRIGLISDTTVASLYGEQVKEQLTKAGADVELLTFPAGERYKGVETVWNLQEQLLDWGIDRQSIIVTLGGGVVTDLGGFVAATLLRGLKLIHIPTTLLGMVDAAIGGKTGYNTRHGKNLIGAIKVADATLIDTAFLRTLPIERLREGIAEMIKHGIVADRTYFDHLVRQNDSLLSLDSRVLQTLIGRSIALKSSIVAKDRQDHGHRAILNFGHTVAHAVEKVSRYQISHGEAVAIGCCVEAELSADLGRCSRMDVASVVRAFEGFGLPVQLPDWLSIEEVMEAMLSDKKCRDSLPRFVMLEKIGSCIAFDGEYCKSVPEEVVVSALKEERDALTLC